MCRCPALWELTRLRHPGQGGNAHRGVDDMARVCARDARADTSRVGGSRQAAQRDPCEASRVVAVQRLSALRWRGRSASRAAATLPACRSWSDACAGGRSIRSGASGRCERKARRENVPGFQRRARRFQSGRWPRVAASRPGAERCCWSALRYSAASTAPAHGSPWAGWLASGAWQHNLQARRSPAPARWPSMELDARRRTSEQRRVFERAAGVEMTSVDSLRRCGRSPGRGYPAAFPINCPARQRLPSLDRQERTTRPMRLGHALRGARARRRGSWDRPRGTCPRVCAFGGVRGPRRPGSGRIMPNPGLARALSAPLARGHRPEDRERGSGSGQPGAQLVEHDRFGATRVEPQVRARG